MSDIESATAYAESFPERIKVYTIGRGVRVNIRTEKGFGQRTVMWQDLDNGVARNPLIAKIDELIEIYSENTTLSVKPNALPPSVVQ